MRQVNSSDATYGTLQKGFNLRWPPTVNSGADSIYICTTHQEVLDSANAALAAGNRITVRSGGHCYEGFVSNKLFGETINLSIIDVGEMKGMEYDENKTITSADDPVGNTYRFKIFTGNQNWDGYLALYRQAGCTIPGGSCYSVGIGGHVSGGGYGLMSRLHGLTVDWVSGVDILVPDSSGALLEKRHVRADSAEDVDKGLFTACCGAGGGNFGIIIAYYFDDLPQAPQQAYWLPLAYTWAEFELQGTFTDFMQAYWGWFRDNDANATSPEIGVGNGGLFTLLKLNHIDASDSVVLAIQYTGPTGLVGGDNDKPLNNFIDTMNAAAGFLPSVYEGFISPNISPTKHAKKGQLLAKAVDESTAMDWLYITQTINGSGNNQRGKYKSDYQIQQFSAAACQALYAGLTTATTEKTFNQALVQIDSYGGAINSNGKGTTAVPQRTSLLKSQYQTYWTDPTADAVHEQWVRDTFADVHNANGGTTGKPETPDYGGCYINYPDIDMKYLDDAHTSVDPQWLKLYYGFDDELIANLIALKNAVDPNNIFRHEMSIPLVDPNS